MDDPGSRITHHASRFTRQVPNLILAFHLALVLLQVGFFGAPLAEGRSIEAIPLPEPLYRVDALGVVLGVTWCIAMALLAWSSKDAPELGTWNGLYLCMMTVGMLNAFYARAPLVLYVGWELVGVGLWLVLRSVRGRKAVSARSKIDKVRLRGLTWNVGWVLHVAGWPLLLMILLGLVSPFAPPAGGVAQAWPLPMALGMAVVALIRSGCPPFEGWFHRAGEEAVGQYWSLIGLYTVASPMLLAKMLVAAPWDAVGVWAVALVGAMALAGSVIIPVLRKGRKEQNTYSLSLAAIYPAAAVMGFGLAPGSSLAAAGAVAIILAGMVCAATFDARHVKGSLALSRTAMLLGAVPGVWLLSQGALGSGYGVVAAILLPAFAILALIPYKGARSRRAHSETNSQAASETASEGGSRAAPTEVRTTNRFTIALHVGSTILVFIAIYPQALVEFVLRPVVTSMAGGVGALSTLKSDWGVGVSVAPAEVAVMAALPATGIAVAVFLAWVVLYWLKGLLPRFVRKRPPVVETE